MEYVLETNGLAKRYGLSKVVDGVDMHVRKGDIYGFIGKNGAGKTTVMKVVCGLIRSNGGSFKLFESDNVEEGRKRIGCLIENPSVFPHMTVKDNLAYYARLKNADRNKADELLDMVGLDSAVIKKKAGNLSLGMKQRLSIAIALLNDPEFLILDEPINGLDPEGIVEIRKLLVKLNEEQGITILISSHILGELEKMATRYGIIRDGKLIKEFDADELQNSSTGKMVIETKDFDKACKLLEENGIEVTRTYEKSGEIEQLFIESVEE